MKDWGFVIACGFATIANKNKNYKLDVRAS